MDLSLSAILTSSGKDLVCIFFIAWLRFILTVASLAPSSAAHGRSPRSRGGSSLRSTFRIASGWCSLPTKVYERSNPPPLSFPSCHPHEIRQLTPATLLPHHSAHVRHRQGSPCSLEGHPYSASRSSLPCPLIGQG